MMTKQTFFLSMLVLLSITGLNQLQSQQLAFPTAEGYGKYVTGGRGGSVYEVTNLNSSGAGSLGDALSAGNRIIVFRVAGTIDGSFNISHDNTTIAGQTAPGDGIAINGYLGISADNLIIRYIRIRGKASDDVIGGRYNDNIIVDHVSASWSSDEIMSIYHGNNVTIQWSMITEACSDDHRFGGIWGNNHSTYHHNLFAHNTDRNPRIASGSGYNDVRNNVMYNWSNESVYGGESQQSGAAEFNFCSTNVVANYFKPGPGTPTAVEKHTRICSPWSRNGEADYGDWYITDNYIVGHPDVTADNWKGVFPQYTDNIDNDQGAIPGLKLNSPSEYMPINQQTAEDAYLSVLEGAGCSFPNRDAVDARIINEVRTGTYTYGDKGFISNPSEVGGIPSLAGGTAPADSDHDGMPDSWETANGLNPNNASDRNNIGADGYTMIEIYINSLVDGTGTPVNVPVTSVTVSPSTITINKNETAQLTASVIPSNASNKGLSWSSANTSVATVSSTGLVTGVAEGSTTIKVTTADGGFTTSCNVSVTSTSNPTKLTIQENETGFCSVDGNIDNNNSGFTGTGFANTDNASGEGITWSVNIPTAGTYSIAWRFANGGSSDRTGQLMVDGSTVVSNVSMPSTGSWSSWTETSTVSVNLSAGTKLIRLQATNSSGLANVDYITLSGGSLSAVACSGLKSVQNPGSLKDNDSELKINCYPNPVGDQLSIEFNRELTETVDIYVLEMTGKTVRFAQTNDSSYKLDMSDLPKGLYTVRILGENLNKVEHIIKQK